MHLLGNMIYLWTFADNVEDATGHLKFLAFFFLCAVIAVFAQAWPDPGARSPVIGASGGLAGVLGAYLLLHPKAEISIAIPIFVDIEIVHLPAWVMLIGWFIFEFILNYFAGASGTVVAFRAHIGGFLAGMLMIPLFVPELRTTLRKRLLQWQ